MKNNNYVGRASSKRKVKLLWLLVAVSLFVGIGILTSYFVQEYKENQKYNLGEYVISLSNSGATAINDEREIKFENILIGQKAKIKLKLNLKNVNCTPTYETVVVTPADEAEDGIEKIEQKLIQNGVYVKLIITGTVYDVDENGTETKNTSLQENIDNIILNSIYPMNNWYKRGNTYYFKGSSNGNKLLLKPSEVVNSTKDIIIQFSNNYVNGEWYDKVVKLNCKLEVVSATMLTKDYDEDWYNMVVTYG